jgi:hypothetical protein
MRGTKHLICMPHYPHHTIRGGNEVLSKTSILKFHGEAGNRSLQM